MRKFLYRLILVQLFLATGAIAQQKELVFPVALVVIESPDSPSPEAQIQLFLDGVARLSEVNARVRFTQPPIIVPDILKLNSLDDYIHRLFAWTKFIEGRRLRKRSRSVHFLLPPVFDSEGGSYGGGAAGGVCEISSNSLRKYSYSIIRLKNQAGEDRREHSRVSALHEILHLLGANHYDRRNFQEVPNVMHSAAMAFVKPNQKLPIASVTRHQVNWCRQGKNTSGKSLLVEVTK